MCVTVQRLPSIQPRPCMDQLVLLLQLPLCTYRGTPVPAGSRIFGRHVTDRYSRSYRWWCRPQALVYRLKGAPRELGSARELH